MLEVKDRQKLGMGMTQKLLGRDRALEACVHAGAKGARAQAMKEPKSENMRGQSIEVFSTDATYHVLAQANVDPFCGKFPYV